MSSAPDVWVKRIGEHRGAPRIFLDAAQAVRAGFAPGDRFEVQMESAKVVLSKSVDGSRVVSSRRRGKNDDAPALPVIDINSKELLSIFDGMDAVRVVVSDERVYILPLASEVRKRERLGRLVRKFSSGEPLASGSLSHGGGVLAHAIHRGLADAGVRCEIAFANEIRSDLLEHAIEHNDAWRRTESARPAALLGAPSSCSNATTMALALPMQELAQDDWLMERLPRLEILEMGLPCSGASIAGKSKRGLTMMEDHPDVGHLAFSALMILNKTQPAVVLFENVPQYAQTASAQILRHQLRDMGYDTHEAVLEGADFGTMENRVRWCMVACTRGVDFDFESIAPAVRVVRRVEDLLDEIGPDDERWKAFEYLHAKRARDESKGNGFRMQFVSQEAVSVPTLRKGYHKAGSTDPLLKHPDREGLYRKFTAAEHARLKGVPDHLVDGLSETVAHEILGQGIVYEPFRAVGERIGRAIAQTNESRSARQGVPSGASGAPETTTGDSSEEAEDAARVAGRDARRMRAVG